ncbi:MAG TPA: IPTL-CTERM sorting domain-containing protein [Thermoanaerobaculia bacterium]|jgi:uncharacterized repeat protein (TIGR01451 family)|nr:IPTL-CTERM sorting domain-containing protein [Thermoanaerobaculia bacterium]
MNVRRALLVLCLAFLPVTSFAVVGADMGITATDSPDPVAPDGNITYTIHVTNAGPAPATTAHLNVVNNGTLLWQSMTVPAGWSCPSLSVGFGGSFTCTAATLLAGSNDTFTIVLNAGKNQIGVNNTTLNQFFGVNATESDPNNANNNVTVSTSYVAPHADMQITATDSPDPVAPDGNITYTVNVTNAGPDATTTAHMNVVMNGTLLFQSMTVPAGWSCPSLSVGFGGSFTCTAANLGLTSSTFTIVLKAGIAQFGVSNQTINEVFGTNSDWADPNNANDIVTVSTSYVAPHADMQITASDSPDPVAPDGNITYTVNVTNAGPDATTNAHMNVILNNTLLWQSMTVPAGWTCPSLSVGSGASFTCTAANFGLTTSTFTIVLKAGSAQFGINNQTINETFTTSSDWGDPNGGNNTATVPTAYVTPHADIQITATDSPDPVAPDGNITYTVTVTNAGPDAAANTTMSVVLNNTLTYQSISIPAGWTCPSLTVGQGSGFTCSIASMAVSTSVFTVVLKAGLAQFGPNNTTINQLFTASSAVADTNNGNNAVTVSTAYVTPHADIQITATDSPDPVAPNGSITYTVTVTNAGPDAAPNNTMSVLLGNGLTYQSITIPAGWSCPSLSIGQGSGFTCSIPSMAVGASIFTVVLKAGLAQIGPNNTTINELFTASSSAADPNSANNAVTVSTSYVVPTANLAVTNSDAPDPVNSGGTITYTQTITNNGPDAATNANITESIGSGVTFQSISAPAGWSCTTPAVGGTGAISCSIASLANAGSASFTVVVNVAAVSGSVSNTITGSSDASDTVQANNSATATTTVTPLPTADLGITKSTPTTNAAPGAAVAYTIVVTNHGPDTATSVTMTDTLPATLLFQSISAPAGYVCTTPTVGTTGTISCTGSSLANGATATFTLNVTSVSNANGAIANTASVSGTPSDPSSGNNSQTSSFTAGSADLGLTGTSGTSGPFITYTFGLTNAGPSAAANVVFTDTLPSSLLFQSITAPPGFTCTTPPVGTSGTITCTATSFANGGTGTFTIVTTAAPGTTGPITNGAGVSSSTSDPNSGNSSVVAPPVTAPATDVPALSTWALMLLAAILGAGALMKMR